MSADAIKNTPIPMISLQEQDEIIEYLYPYFASVDSLISEKESLIEDIESYKKSLIYEVVTGKCKVVD